MTASGLTPVQALGLAVTLLVAVLLLYRLKDHRRRVVVAFAGLWQMANAGSPSRQWRERLRRAASLLLQCLIAGLLCAALVDPRAALDGPRANHLVILFDTSASMNTRERHETRFATAQRELIRFLEGLEDSTQVLLTSASGRMLPLLPWTTDRESLVAAVRRLTPGESASNWADCLATAAEQLAQKPHPRLLLVTDAAAADFAELVVAPGLAQLPMQAILVGESRYNVGIVAIAARSRPGQYRNADLMVVLQNDDTRAHAVSLEVTIEERVVGTFDVTIAAEAKHRFDLAELALHGHALTARLRVLDAPTDGFSIDDQGYVAMPEVAKSRVAIVSQGDLYLEAAVLSDNLFEPKLLSPKTTVEPSEFDAAILHGLEPAGPMQVPAFIIDPPENGRLIRVGAAIERFGFDTWNHRSSLLRGLDLYDVQVDRGRRLLPSEGDEELARAGRSVILLRGTRDGVPVVALGFDPRQSDFVLRPTWPLFVRQVLEELLSRDAAPTYAVRPLEEVNLAATTASAMATVAGPGGQSRYPVVAGAPWTIVPDRVGHYRISTPAQRSFVAVNLASMAESRIAPMRPLIYGGREIKPPSQPPRKLGIPQPIELAAAALLLLLVEWMTFHRRWTV